MAGRRDGLAFRWLRGLHVHATASAELAFLMALLFTIAYAFYRQQPK